MTRPGDRLRSLMQRFCDPQTMERLIDPVIADLQCEHSDAIRRGQTWRARLALLSGYLAFWKVVAISIGGASTRALTASHDGAVGRIVRFSGIATAVIVGIMVWPPLRSMRYPASGKTALFIVYLLPQALSIALPMGLVFGVMSGLRRTTPTRRVRRAITLLILASGLAALVIDGWVLPHANQAFRELSYGGRLGRGVNELTLDQLWQSARDRFVIPVIKSRRTFEFNFRLAMAFAPLALGLFALGVATARRRASSVPMIGLIALVSCCSYYALLYWAHLYWVDWDRVNWARTNIALAAVVFAAWGPNLLFLALAALLWTFRTPGPSAAGPSHPDDGRRSEDRPVNLPA
jgi:hypothetical protein